MLNVAVIGAGPMGTSIAGEIASHGYKVRMYDRKPLGVPTAMHKLAEDRSELIAKGIIAPDNNFLELIINCPSLREAVADSDLVFEAIVEDLSLKQALFKETASYCRSSTVLASNTISLNVSDIASPVPFPERVIGVRFLYPVYGIRGVELTVTQATSTEAKTAIVSFLEAVGKRSFVRAPGGSAYRLLPEEAADLQREFRRLSQSSGMRSVSCPVDRSPKGSFTLEMMLQQAQSTLSSSLPVSTTDGHGGPGGSGGHSALLVGQVESSPEGMHASLQSCVVCMDSARNALLSPCNHFCVCLPCANLLINRLGDCPICRQRILNVVEVFVS